MSRTRQVLVDDRVTKFWSSSAKSGFELGLLVGQVSASNCGDLILSVVPVPSESESGEAPTGLNDVSVDWVQEVAQQVDRLLPGGISVLGLYVVSSRDILTQLVPYLRATAEAVALPSNVHFGDDVSYLALVFPNGDSTFQSFYDVMDVSKTQMLLAEHKSSTTNIQLKQFRTLVDLNEPTSFVNVAPSATIVATEVAERRMNEVEKQLQPLFRRVEDSIAVLKPTGDSEVHHINLLSLAPSGSQQFVENPLGGVHGTICCVAFVSQSEPEVSEVAAKYLKRDFVKSVLVRVALARERWAEDDEAESNAVFKDGGVIPLAQRGLVSWSSDATWSSHFSATIHLFPDEDAAKAMKNALEILGDDVNRDAVWTAIEIGGQLGSPTNVALDLTASESFKHVNYLVPVFIVLILLLAQYIM